MLVSGVSTHEVSLSRTRLPTPESPGCELGSLRAPHNRCPGRTYKANITCWLHCSRFNSWFYARVFLSLAQISAGAGFRSLMWISSDREYCSTSKASRASTPKATLSCSLPGGLIPAPLLAFRDFVANTPPPRLLITMFLEDHGRGHPEGRALPRAVANELHGPDGILPE